MSYKDMILLIFVSLLFMISVLSIVTRAEDTMRYCPDNTYEVGRIDADTPICKTNPTGCQYGDSIPMDMCDKFAPEAEVKEVKSEVVEMETGK